MRSFGIRLTSARLVGLCLGLAAAPVAATHAHATSVSADLNGNMSTGQVGDVNHASSNGTPISGTLTSGATGSFFSDPGTGVSNINGTSATVVFGTLSPGLVSSQVHGQLRYANNITFSGFANAQQHVKGFVVERYSGSLLPNTTYEDAYHAFWVAHGVPNAQFNSATAVITGFTETLALGFHTITTDYQSRLCTGANCLVSDNVVGAYSFAFDVSQSEATLSFGLDQTGSGSDGGGFAFDPIFDLAFNAPGISFTGGDAFIRTVPLSATPIPSSALLLVTGCLGMVGLGRCRKARG